MLPLAFVQSVEISILSFARIHRFEAALHSRKLGVFIFLKFINCCRLAESQCDNAINQSRRILF